MVPSFVGAVACSGGDDGTEIDLGGGRGPITEMLAALPAGESDGSLTVAYGDLTVAADVAGVERPTDPDDREAVSRYVSALSGYSSDDEERSQVAVAWPSMAEVQTVARMDEFVADVGWTILDVDQFIERQTPPESVMALRGYFDRSALNEAMGQAEDGVWVAGDPDGRDLAERTAARPLGQPQWLSLQSNWLLITESAEDMDAARSEGDPRETLAEDDRLAALAGALDGEDVYTALLANDASATDPVAGAPLRELSPEVVEAICAKALPERPLSLAAGLADDGGPVVVFALLHEDDAAAEANAEAIERMVEEGSSYRTRQRWSELVTLDRVTADGTITVVRLRPTEETSVGIWYDVFLTRDTLVSAC